MSKGSSNITYCNCILYSTKEEREKEVIFCLNDI
jgi:hypothetical protein